jgi:YggT family protein
MGAFLYSVVDTVTYNLLGLLVLALILNAILSWLVAFDIINLRNRFMYQLAHFLDAVSRPVLRPFQRFIPPIGGIDITPIIAILLIGAVQRGIHFYLLPALFRPTFAAVGG